MNEQKQNENAGASTGNTSKILTMREEPRKVFWTPERKKDAREWVVSIGTALIIVVLIRTFLFDMIYVEGESMIETLQNGNRLFVTIPDVKLNGVERGNIVICHYPDERKNFVKRVVGLAGDTIEIRDGVTYVNGEACSEAFVTYPARMDYGPTTVPEGCVFVMGDNRANSRDSRYSNVGPLEEDMIVGRVRFVWWPLSDWGPVE